jgi:hypothetical protein
MTLRVDSSSISCGIDSITGVAKESPENFIRVIKRHISASENDERRFSTGDVAPPMFMFSDNENGRGGEIAAYIRKNKIGNIRNSPRVIGIHGVKIAAWFWAPPKQWY